VSALSGGERNRLLLAKLFARPANLLVLDEPTNDLDIETLELLEEVIADYAGTLLLVSHDRRFLDRTVTAVLAVTADGRVEEHVGGYRDWLRYHQTTVGAASGPRLAGDSDRDREAVRSPSAKAAPTELAQAVGVSEHRPRKLGYKEQRELAALPDLIERLEAEQQSLQAHTTDPDFYRQDADTVAAAMRALTDLEARLQQAYERWEALDG
jgi:ATP-binding cassette subfamily F protein uup